MAELETVMDFDKAERALIQMALRRYMEENIIGVPTLVDRIIKADKPRLREIPLSTLQRFIRNPNRTERHHVELCYDFARELPYYSAESELTGLGRSLSAFYRAPQDRADTPPDYRLLAGEFNARVIQALPAGQKRLGLLKYNADKDRVDYSTVVFEPASATGFLRVSERVFNPNAVDLLEHEDQPSHTYEGVAVATSSDTAVALQRDILTRQPRTCYLTRASNQSNDLRTLYYMQAVWVPFQSGPLTGNPVSRVEIIYLSSAEDDRRRTDETVCALDIGLYSKSMNTGAKRTALRRKSGDNTARVNAELLQAAYDGNPIDVKVALEQGALIASTHEVTGLTALHIAVGTCNFAMVWCLIEDYGAPFGPDKFGRWPTLIAAECQVSDGLSDYIVEQEARYLDQNRST